MNKTQICNMALANIGSTNTIASIDDGSNEANVLKGQWDAAVDHLLEAHEWTFATVRRALSLSGIAPDEWAYSYALPSDCLTPLWVQDSLKTRLPDKQIKFKVEVDPDPEQRRRLLFTDQGEAVLVFVYRVVETGRWTQHFTDALAWYLAMKIAPAFAKKRETFMDAAKMYYTSLNEARAHDANSYPANPPDSTPFIEARR